MAFIEPRNRLHVVSPSHVLATARTAIVLDASCDLPPEFYEQPGVIVLPINVRIGSREYTDNHSPQAISRFLADDLGARGAHAETRPYSADEIRALFLERLALDYDSVYCLTITAKRSAIHDNAMRASVEVLRDSREVRQAAGITRPYMLRVVDTKNLFSGQGIPALALADMIERGLRPAEIMPQLFRVIESTWGYFVPDDLHFLRTRAKKRGDRSVGLLSAVLGSTLDIKPVVRAHMGNTEPVAKSRGREETLRKLFRFVGDRIHAGLLIPHVNVSYGGDLAELQGLPGYHELADLCEAKQIALHASMMSITGCVTVGSRGVAIAFAGPPHEISGF